MMRLVKINKNNLQIALRIAYSIFPGKNDRKYLTMWYKKYVNNKCGSNMHVVKYFIAYISKEPVGITGLYQFKGVKDIWLGWFGVVKEARRHGIGSEILQKTITVARKTKAPNLRVYTISKKAMALYEKNGFKKTKSETWCIADGKKIFPYPAKSTFYIKKLKA